MRLSARCNKLQSSLRRVTRLPAVRIRTYTCCALSSGQDAALAVHQHSSRLARVLGTPLPRFMSIVERCPSVLHFSSEVLGITVEALADLTGLDKCQVQQLVYADPVLLQYPDLLKVNLASLRQLLGSLSPPDLSLLLCKEPALGGLDPSTQLARLLALQNTLCLISHSTDQAAQTQQLLQTQHPYGNATAGIGYSWFSTAADDGGSMGNHGSIYDGSPSEPNIGMSDASASMGYASTRMSHASASMGNAIASTSNASGSSTGSSLPPVDPACIQAVLRCPALLSTAPPQTAALLSAHATALGAPCSAIAAIIIQKPALLWVEPAALHQRVKFLSELAGISPMQVLAHAAQGPDVLAQGSGIIDRKCRDVCSLLHISPRTFGAMLLQLPELLHVHAVKLRMNGYVLDRIEKCRPEWMQQALAEPSQYGALLLASNVQLARLRFFAEMAHRSVAHAQQVGPAVSFAAGARIVQSIDGVVSSVAEHECTNVTNITAEVDRTGRVMISYAINNAVHEVVMKVGLGVAVLDMEDVDFAAKFPAYKGWASIA